MSRRHKTRDLGETRVMKCDFRAIELHNLQSQTQCVQQRERRSSSFAQSYYRQFAFRFTLSERYIAHNAHGRLPVALLCNASRSVGV